MANLTYPGVNIQAPISELILSGEKTIETRSYPIPKHYVGKEMILIETPGKVGKFKSRMRGIVVFEECFQYRSKSEFYNDSKKHFVLPGSIWGWNSDKEKWGWLVSVIEVFDAPKPLAKRTGIKYSKAIKLNCDT